MILKAQLAATIFSGCMADSEANFDICLNLAFKGAAEIMLRTGLENLARKRIQDDAKK